MFTKYGYDFNPMKSSGGGVVYVGSFALLTAVFNLSQPKKRPILLLDEPFTGLKGKEANEKAIQMVKEISKQVGIQIIMVSDERAPLEEIEKGADKIFRVSMKNGKSKINE